MSGNNGDNFQTGYYTGVVSDPVSEAGARSRKTQEEANAPGITMRSDPSLRVDIRGLAGGSIIGRVLTGAIIPEIFEAIGAMAHVLISTRAVLVFSVVLGFAGVILAASYDVSAALGTPIPYEAGIIGLGGFALPYLFLAAVKVLARALAVFTEGLLNLFYSLAWVAFLLGIVAALVYLVWIVIAH